MGPIDGAIARTKAIKKEEKVIKIDKIIPAIPPHLDHMTEGENEMDVILYFPFIILLLWMVAMCIFCRPIRKLFKCDKWFANKTRDKKAKYSILYPAKRRSSLSDEEAPILGKGFRLRSNV